MAQTQHQFGRSEKRFDIFAFLQRLRYNKENPAVADAAFMKLSAHQWYLSEEIIAFLFFSQHSSLTNKVKESMALRLLSMPPPDEFCGGYSCF